MQQWERETLECEVENIDFPEYSFKSIVSKLSSPWKSLPHTITRVLWPRKSNPNWTSSLSGHLTGYLWKASLISSASAAWGQTRGTIVQAHMRGERGFPARPSGFLTSKRLKTRQTDPVPKSQQEPTVEREIRSDQPFPAVHMNVTQLQ